MISQGSSLAPQWTFLGTFLVSPDAPWHPMDSPWHQLLASRGTPWHPMDIPWQQLWPSSENVSKMIKKTIMLSFISNVLLGRVYMQSDHAGAVQTHIFTFVCSPFQDLQKSKRFKCAADPGRGHLGHILDKGGTGGHLEGLWGPGLPRGSQG